MFVKYDFIVVFVNELLEDGSFRIVNIIKVYNDLVNIFLVRFYFFILILSIWKIFCFVKCLLILLFMCNCKESCVFVRVSILVNFEFKKFLFGVLF